MPYERKTLDLCISEELRSLLNSIKDDSIVARMILKKRQKKEDLVKDYVNYLSISSQDRTKISYLSQDRISSIDSSEYWSSSRRYQAKPGSFVAKIFSNISSKEVESFSTLFRTMALKPNFKFLVVNGEDIKKYYHWESYSKDKGTLGVSCMKHDNCQKLLDIYTDSEQVSMLVMLDENDKLMGRALLWNTSPDKIMDRIYTIDDESLRFHFKRWATDNNYWYKSEQNWYNTLQFEQLGKQKVELQIGVELENFRYYPYMDTFKFVNIRTNTIFNYIPKEFSNDIRTLVACDGSKYDSDYLRFDGVDRIFRYRGETVYIDYLDIFTHENNTRWSRLNDKYILVVDSKYSDELDDYIFIDETKNKEIPKKKKKEKKSIISELNFYERFNYITEEIIRSGIPREFLTIQSTVNTGVIRQTETTESTEEELSF
jgi:hypothetical protein